MPFHDLSQAYVNYLREDCGLAENSIRVYTPFVRDFLEQLAKAGSASVKAIDAHTIRSFLLDRTRGDALRYMGGTPARIMIDNTHVVVLRGTGRDMVPVPELAAFGERFGFQFVAHAIGDANRSGRVERPFSFIE